ncbi:MAG: hypothetical protein AVDCRST_MAG33-372 [uncultured Thermomicrobiales bacterium]|uniref:Uncharacterized protein n=1 Tax=uncultured Thermomicrobiales bacterium TaxID=1645740 RepID=A0A6J4UD46_9BACT|nr:MAG: hypothetical protein AVDCRST_MAG33-372 [uncultured Thermomicrobiales bacterium]
MTGLRRRATRTGRGRATPPASHHHGRAAGRPGKWLGLVTGWRSLSACRHWRAGRAREPCPARVAQPTGDRTGRTGRADRSSTCDAGWRNPRTSDPAGSPGPRAPARAPDEQPRADH